MPKPKKGQDLSRIRDRKALWSYLESHEWTIEHRRSNHLKLTSPSGRAYFTGTTPSDKAAIRNLISDLKKLGLE